MFFVQMKCFVSFPTRLFSSSIVSVISFYVKLKCKQSRLFASLPKLAIVLDYRGVVSNIVKIVFNQHGTFHVGGMLIPDMSFPHFETVKFRLTALTVFLLYLEAVIRWLKQILIWR